MRRLISRIVALSVIAILPLVLTLARAQQPTEAPNSGFPEKAPPGWKQSDWNILRARCLKLGAEMTSRQHMTPEQLKGLPPLSYSDLETCISLMQRPPAPRNTSTPGITIRMPPPPPPHVFKS
jgi:hypothetical protein